MKEPTVRQLIDNVIQWANDRSIIEGSTPIKQLDKTSEEFNELQRAVASYYTARKLGSYSLEAKSLADMEDGFGDVLVTLIIAAKQLDIDLQDALAAAYEEIKDRKGRMISGKFVKESDL